MKASDLFSLLRQTFKEWSDDKASRIAAAIAYYTVFSLAPVLVIIVAIAGFVLGEEAAQGQIVGQISGAVGEEAAGLIEGMIASAAAGTSGGTLATIISVGLLIFGATGLFAQIQDALNTIWDVEPEKTSGLVATARAKVIDRLSSFLIVAVIGVLLIVAVLASTVVSTIIANFSDLIPGSANVLLVANWVISFAIVTLLFAVIYKVLPDTDISWGDVWVGAAVTSVLFVIGKELIALYIGMASTGSVYGAAGSLAVLLLFIYLSAQIILFGAEFTQVYANRFGSRLKAATASQPGAVVQTGAAGEQARPAQASQPEAGLEKEAAPVPVGSSGGQRSPLTTLRDGLVGAVVGVAFAWMLGSVRGPRT